MTPRQARTERRAAERKAKKAEMRRNKQVSLELDNRPPEEEFSAELMAEANATRDRVHRRAAASKLPTHDADYPADLSSDREGAPANPGFVSQSPASPVAPQPSGFVSQGTRRAEINRKNSQYSTGPRTPTGKLASSRNSLKHGLASGQVIIPGEDTAAFDALLAALLDEHQPTGPPEEFLVNEMAQSYWLAQRALRLQNECFTPEGVDDKRLSLYMRYHTTHERAFHKALTALMKVKKEQSRGFVSQSRERAAANRGFVSQQADESLQPSPESSTAPAESEFVRQSELSEAA